MKACPKCGGTNGFTYKLCLKTKRLSSWDRKEDEEVAIEPMTETNKLVKTGICQDCQQKIQIPPYELAS